MRLHDRVSEHAYPLPGGWAFKAWCQCDGLAGQPFAGRARTLRGARRMVKGKLRDHRGFAAAAGPVWTDH